VQAKSAELDAVQRQLEEHHGKIQQLERAKELLEWELKETQVFTTSVTHSHNGTQNS